MKTLTTLTAIGLAMAISSPAFADDAKTGKKRMSPEQKMKMLDRDGDGRISRDEFIEGAMARLDKRFKRLDANGDSFVDQAEFELAREQRKKRREEYRKRQQQQQPEQ